MRDNCCSYNIPHIYYRGWVTDLANTPPLGLANLPTNTDQNIRYYKCMALCALIIISFLLGNKMKYLHKYYSYSEEKMKRQFPIIF